MAKRVGVNALHPLTMPETLSLFLAPSVAVLLLLFYINLRVASPVLIDEWQRLPEVWDIVRRDVDDRAQRGRYLLTGSAVPTGASLHSGAGRIVGLVMHLPYPGEEDRKGPDSRGWRRMAVALGLPPWQARRLCVVLLGTVTWPGLLARLIHDGPHARHTPAMQAALRSTRYRSMRSPVLTAIRADDEYAVSYPQLAAG